MTSQPQNQNSAPLRVVPPTTDTPQEQPAPPVPPTPDPDSETTSAKPQQEPTRHRWLWVGTAVATLGAVGFIPLPNHVRGDATLKTLPGQRQTIHMSRPGRVRLRVRPHDRVQPDQVLLSVESEDLADQLTEAERSLQEENAALEVAQQRLARSQQRLRNAEDQLHQAQRRLDAHLDDMRAIQLGIGIPQTRRFQEERGAIEAEHAGDHYEIERLQGERQRLESRAAAINGTLTLLRGEKREYEEEKDELAEMVENRLIGKRDDLIRDTERELRSTRRQIAEQEGEQQQNQDRIAQIQSQIRGQEASLNRRDHQANVTREQEQQVRWDLNQKRMDLEEERDRRQAERDTAHNERETATIQVQNHQEAIAARQAQLEDLRKRDAERTKTATISGIVLDHNLDQRDGAFMQAGQEVLQIANLSYLEVTAQIAQADYHLVEKGQLVEFRMRNQPRDITYRSSIENRRPLTDRRESGIEDVFEVTFHIENPENLRLPEDKGYVQIRTENRNFYQKIQHQFGKLIDLGYYFPWLAD